MRDDAERLPAEHEEQEPDMTGEFDATPDAYAEIGERHYGADVISLAEHRRTRDIEASRVTAESQARAAEALKDDIVAEVGRINRGIADHEKPNPYYPKRIALGFAKIGDLFTRGKPFTSAVEAGHRITSSFRTRREERSFGLNHLKEDFLTRPVRAIRRSARIDRLEAKKRDRIRELAPDADPETVDRAIGRGREHQRSVIGKARRRLHTPIAFASAIGTRREATDIANELVDSGAVKPEGGAEVIPFPHHPEAVQDEEQQPQADHSQRAA